MALPLTIYWQRKNLHSKKKKRKNERILWNLMWIIVARIALKWAEYRPDNWDLRWQFLLISYFICIFIFIFSFITFFHHKICYLLISIFSRYFSLVCLNSYSNCYLLLFFFFYPNLTCRTSELLCCLCSLPPGQHLLSERSPTIETDSFLKLLWFPCTPCSMYVRASPPYGIQYYSVM